LSLFTLFCRLRLIHYLQPKEWENEIVRRVEKIAGEKGWTMSQVALAWINEKVTSPIVGFSSVSRFMLEIARNTAHITPGEASRGGYYPRLQAHARGDQDAGRAVPAAEHPRPSVTFRVHADKNNAVHISKNIPVAYGEDEEVAWILNMHVLPTPPSELRFSTSPLLMRLR
jgi:hypothetical protein